MAIRVADIIGGLGSSAGTDKDDRVRSEYAEVISQDAESAETYDRANLGISPLAELEKALEGREFSLHRHRFLLLLRFLLVNLVGVAARRSLCAGLGYQGHGRGQHRNGVADFWPVCRRARLCGWKIWRASNELNLIKAYDPLKPSPSRPQTTRFRAPRWEHGCLWRRRPNPVLRSGRAPASKREAVRSTSA